MVWLGFWGLAEWPMPSPLPSSVTSVLWGLDSAAKERFKDLPGPFSPSGSRFYEFQSYNGLKSLKQLSHFLIPKCKAAFPAYCTEKDAELVSKNQLHVPVSAHSLKH